MKCTRTLLILLISSWFSWTSVYGGTYDNWQIEDSTEEEEDSPKSSDTLEFEFKPRVGLGIGMFTFYGDIASNHLGYHPTVSRLGYDLSLTNPLTDFLDLSFYVVFGTVSANERSLTRNLNFQSDITTGGFTLNYNFDHILKEDRIIDPYIGVGIESFEFLSKTDLKDVNGVYYNYWSDGTIRDIAENDPTAALAQVIYRDYTYETDLRELNADGNGKYPERSWAIPIVVGANLHLGERVKFRIGTSLHLTMTDLVDDVTGESDGDRAGTMGNDKFVYTSFALTYDLKISKKKKIDEEEERFVFDPSDCELDSLDSDNDGVSDFCDSCQKSLPEYGPVDEHGCALDDDEDGVPNYRDDELDTPPNAIVDEKGVGLDDEDWLARYNRYIDSLGIFGDDFEVENLTSTTENPFEFTNNPDKQLGAPREYFVVMGNDKNPLKPEEFHKILSHKKFKILEKGDTTWYVMGGYDTAEEAVAFREYLIEQGLDPEAIIEATETPEGDLTMREVDTTGLTTSEVDTAVHGSGIVLRIQLGAFRYNLSRNVFSGIPDLVKITAEDQLTRYYTGAFTDRTEAAKHKIQMLSEGYAGAFIVAYEDGKRLYLSQAGFEVTNPGADVITPSQPNDSQIKSELVNFRVQVGSYAREIPIEILDLYIKIGQDENIGRVEAKNDPTEGVVKYFVGFFNNYEEAQEFQKEVIREGLLDAFVVGDFDGRIISAQEAISLKNQ